LPEEDEPGLDISSLIDICFLLLIYFLVTSTIQPKEFDLGLKLPSSAPSDEKPKIEPLMLVIKDDGSVFERRPGMSDNRLAEAGPAPDKNGAIVPRDNGDKPGQKGGMQKLFERLDEYKSVMSGSEKPLVQLSVEGSAKEQWVVDVLNALAGAKISSVTFTDLTNK